MKVGPNSATKEKSILLWSNISNVNVTAKSKRR
jgi:hypothetical protein